MAGLWERIRPGADDRISVHMLVASLKGYGTAVFTKLQVKNALNGILESPLTAEEETDLNNLANQLDSLLTLDKRGYENKLEALTIAAELGQVGETKWRTDLGI